MTTGPSIKVNKTEKFWYTTSFSFVSAESSTSARLGAEESKSIGYTNK